MSNTQFLPVSLGDPVMEATATSQNWSPQGIGTHLSQMLCALIRFCLRKVAQCHRQSNGINVRWLCTAMVMARLSSSTSPEWPRDQRPDSHITLQWAFSMEGPCLITREPRTMCWAWHIIWSKLNRFLITNEENLVQYKLVGQVLCASLN